tara:strand:+ start:589 stop:738 length:150 start_codon:yes stop_codon:yes gene_type:complete
MAIITQKVHGFHEHTMSWKHERLALIEEQEKNQGLLDNGKTPERKNSLR